MRALLNVDVARHLGIVLLKPGSELIKLFGKGRVLVEMPPAHMDSVPSGRLPDARQPLREDSELLSFFLNERVIKAAGGINALELWLERKVKHCQWTHSIYHHHELVTFRHDPGAIRACWHCDNELRNQTAQTLDKLVALNVADWIINTVLIYLGYNSERMLSLAELCWWAVCKGVGSEISEEMARRSLRMKKEEFKSVYRESELVPSVQATSILTERLNGADVPIPGQSAAAPTAVQLSPAKPVLDVIVDSEAPATFFARPKRIRWVSPDFLTWVKTQPCMCCGQPADDAHHLIGWGQGGVGTKAHDIFTIPLCRKHHRQLHEDPLAFEREHSTQPVLIIKLLDRAYALGVLA
ncbi:DUF968 domain-containing protein [Klebsiella michiganensis]|uniref:DUF968 domain-containing protein n=1 Tax=Klebsiella michiganensis TaxID=1134687 RepID=UPI00249C18A5|nr:DUF968 domain-containing protein [Klebsiella michiganensis]MDI3221446.1 DUF968 domain-containing protein [Klebsiella michiganensis]